MDNTCLFIAENAACLINQLEVGKDGKTAYERCRGKQAIVMANEFGEKILWKVARWRNGDERGGLGGNQRGSAGCEIGEEYLRGRARATRRAVEPEEDGDPPGAPGGPAAAGADGAGSMDHL